MQQSVGTDAAGICMIQSIFGWNQDNLFTLQLFSLSIICCLFLLKPFFLFSKCLKSLVYYSSGSNYTDHSPSDISLSVSTASSQVETTGRHHSQVQLLLSAVEVQPAERRLVTQLMQWVLGRSLLFAAGPFFFRVQFFCTRCFLNVHSDLVTGDDNSGKSVCE